MTFSSRFLANIVRYVALTGNPIAELSTLLQLSPEEMSSQDKRVDAQTYHDFIETCVSLTNDPFFGQHFGHRLQLSAAGLMTQVAQHAATVKEAFEQVCHFNNLGCQALPLALERKKEAYYLKITPLKTWRENYPETTRHTLEGAVTFTCRQFEALSFGLQSPQKILLDYAHSAPEELSKLTRCPVLTNQSVNALVFSESQINSLIPTADKEIFQSLLLVAQTRNSFLDQQASYTEKVTNLLLEQHDHRFPDMEEIAATLALSPRTLQRRLKEENAQFSEILQEIKIKKACKLLQDSSLKVARIANLLGYQDLSSFSRSFKKAQSLSPQQFRDLK